MRDESSFVLGHCWYVRSNNVRKLRTGIPQLREAGWFVTGSDRDPVRHLFVRMEEQMDGTGIWTVELHECRGRRGDAGRAVQSYRCEARAREALQPIYRLSRHLVALPTWNEQQLDEGRWRLRVREPTEQHSQQRRPVRVGPG